MTFDALGRRRSCCTITGNVTNDYKTFVYQDFLCIQERSGATNEERLSFVWDPTEDLATRPLVISTPENTYYAFHDANKNVSELVSAADNSLAAQYEYAPFGALLSATGSFAQQNPFRFSSEYYDTTLGCIYYNYRHYNPLDGRWISRDPIEEKERTLNKKKKNPEIIVLDYLFVNNDPFCLYDLLGLRGRMSRGTKFARSIPARAYKYAKRMVDQEELFFKALQSFFTFRSAREKGISRCRLQKQKIYQTYDYPVITAAPCNCCEIIYQVTPILEMEFYELYSACVRKKPCDDVMREDTIYSPELMNRLRYQFIPW